jgi:multiple sugar transport system ATP-binding protein
MTATAALLAPTDPGHNGVSLKKVSKTIAGTQILAEIDLDIFAEELLVLLGPSGCGKTTTLNIIAGVETASSGSVYFGSEDVTSVPPERRDVAMVFQSVGLYPHLNVHDNITFPLRLRKVPRATIDERVAVTTELLGIGHLLKRRIHAVSGGERQRVAIAKALVKRPRVFLLDEPFSSLDAEIRRQLRGELVRIQRELRTTMVFVTHDQEEAMSIGDRIVVMNKGRGVQIGPPLDVYKWPRNLWAAKFVGNYPINVLGVRSERGRIILEPPEALDLGPGEKLPGWSALRGAAKLCLRPESISLMEATADPSLPSANVVIRQVLGSSILYDLALPGRTVIRVLARSTSPHSVGEEVRLAIDWGQARLFGGEGDLLLTPVEEVPNASSGLRRTAPRQAV